MYKFKEKIHICHVCTTFIHRAGGINRLFSRLRAMIDEGYQVSLVVGRDYEFDKSWDIRGLSIYKIPSLVKYIDPIKDVASLLELMKLFIKIRPHVVHTHLAKAGIIGRLSAFLTNIQWILHTVHGPTFSPTLPLHKRWLFRTLEQICGIITHHFIFVGQEIRNQYVEAGVCSLQDTTVIYTGRPDNELIEVKNISMEKIINIRKSFFKEHDIFILACIGRIVPSKQQDHAIRIISRLHQRGVNAKLIIIGDAFLEEEKFYADDLEKLINNLGVERHVFFSGYRKDVLQIMAACDAIIHTSKYEGLPNILVEAGLVSKPIVCYLVSGANEVVKNHITGFIVDQGDIVEATERMHYLASHSSHAIKMGRVAYESLRHDHCETAMNKKKIAIYRKLFQKKNGARNKEKWFAKW